MVIKTFKMATEKEKISIELDANEGYEKVDLYNGKNIKKLSSHYKGILELIGEDVHREGLSKTPDKRSL